MRSSVLARSSIAAFSFVVLGAMTVQVMNLSVSIPAHHLRVAWGLTRILLQL